MMSHSGSPDAAQCEFLVQICCWGPDLEQRIAHSQQAHAPVTLALDAPLRYQDKGVSLQSIRSLIMRGLVLLVDVCII